MPMMTNEHACLTTQRLQQARRSFQITAMTATNHDSHKIATPNLGIFDHDKLGQTVSKCDRDNDGQPKISARLQVERQSS